MNPNPEITISRVVDELKLQPASEDGAQRVLQAWNAPAPPTKTRYPLRGLKLAFSGAAILAAAGAVFLTLDPKPSAASVIERLRSAMKDHPYEIVQLFQPDKHGHLVLLGESWYGPNRFAEHWTIPHPPSRTHSDLWTTQIGERVYQYRSDERTQEIFPRAYLPKPDPRSIKAFEKYPLIRSVESAHSIRYILGDRWRMDVIVDKTTHLPLERINYDPKGEVLSEFFYQFPQSIPETRFEPMRIPNVPFYNAFDDRKHFTELMHKQPQVVTIHGIRVRLYGVIIDSDGDLGAIVQGGSLAPSAFPTRFLPGGKWFPSYLIRVAELPQGFFMQVPEALPKSAAPFLKGIGPVGSESGGPIQLETVSYGKAYESDRTDGSVDKILPATPIPDRFTLEIPIWSETFHDNKAHAPIGVAHFEVTDPLRMYRLNFCFSDGPPTGAWSDPGLIPVSNTAAASK